MNCSNCGTFNNDGSKFCINCGQSLVNDQTKIDPQLNKNENNFQSGNTTIQSIDHNVATTKLLLVSYFFTILAVILKPSTVYKEELNKFNELKNSIILERKKGSGQDPLFDSFRMSGMSAFNVNGRCKGCSVYIHILHICGFCF